MSISAESWARFVDVWSQATEKSWTDAHFKEELARDPAATLKKEYGFDMPPDFEIRIAKNNETPKVTLTAKLSMDTESLAQERIALASMYPLIYHKTC